MTTAEPFSWPGWGSKMVRVGMSWQAFPLACGAGPGQRRMVCTPRKGLFSPGVAQGAFCFWAGARRTHEKSKETKSFMGEDYRSRDKLVTDWWKFPAAS